MSSSTPTTFNPPLGKHGIDRELRRLRDAISQHPALEFVKEDSQTIGGFGRNDAIFPPFELAELIGTEYERQCRILCYGPFPTWAEVRARFSDMRELL